MNTMRSIAFLFLLAAGCPVHAAENVNLVKNSSFEFKFYTASGGQVPLYWLQYSGTAGSFGRATDHKQGECSVKLMDNSNAASVGIWSDSIRAYPGQVFTVRAWGKKSADSVISRMYLKFLNASSQVISTSPGISVGSVDSWSESSTSATAPANTAYVRVLLLSDNASVGTAYFDCVSLTLPDTVSYILKYASPTGTGSGDYRSTPANYTDSSFWSKVNTAAALNPVQVVLLPGNYTKQLTLDGIGNATHRILISGETPYAVNYCGTDANADYFIYITNSRNITFRHLHFTATETIDPYLSYEQQLAISDYDGVVRLEGGANTQDIRFEGLSFTDMLLMATHAVSTYGASCHDITWDRCAWAGIGYDIYDHCSYNSENSYNLNFTDCFFQDCAGAYVRYRSGSRGSVENCTFISTGNVRTADHYDRVHFPFIQICAYVSDNHPDEKLGTAFLFQNNSFTYEQTGLSGFLSPYQISVSGKAPSSHPAWHLVPKNTAGITIADTEEVTATRNTLFAQYFGVDLIANYNVAGVNAYNGCWDIRCCMNIIPDPITDNWSCPPSEDEAENADMDCLVDIDDPVVN